MALKGQEDEEQHALMKNIIADLQLIAAGCLNEADDAKRCSDGEKITVFENLHFLPFVFSEEDLPIAIASTKDMAALDNPEEQVLVVDALASYDRSRSRYHSPIFFSPKRNLKFFEEHKDDNRYCIYGYLGEQHNFLHPRKYVTDLYKQISIGEFRKIDWNWTIGRYTLSILNSASH